MIDDTLTRDNHIDPLISQLKSTFHFIYLAFQRSNVVVIGLVRYNNKYSKEESLQ